MRVLVRLLGATVLALVLARPVVAGPPYVSDDPEPTPNHVVEINSGLTSGAVPRIRSIVECVYLELVQRLTFSSQRP